VPSVVRWSHPPATMRAKRRSRACRGVTSARERPMGERTHLYDLHLALGAKMIDCSGWEMPLHYGSQVEEHHQVRRDCGVFDVSHLCVVDVTGPAAQGYLQRLLANDVARLDATGKALYSVALNERGG